MASDRQDIHNSEVPVLCRSCEARHRGMCGVLEPEQLVELARNTHKARHQPGTELIGDSTEIHSYANVMRGVVKLSKVLEDGRQQLVGLQFAPDFLGRLFGQESSVTAEAASSVDLCVVPKATLEQLIAKSPALEHKLMQQTLRELDEARTWMVTLGRKTALEKVASFLHLIATHHGRGRPGFTFDAFDKGGDRSLSDHEDALDEQELRFHRLQRRFGPWGLAWLEAVLRAADWAVSRDQKGEGVP